MPAAGVAAADEAADDATKSKCAAKERSKIKRFDENDGEKYRQRC